MTPIQDTLFIALRAFILSLIQNIQVVQGLGNGVPMPVSRFVCMTANSQARLSTNVSSYDPVAGERDVMQPTEYSIQLDCYGPESSDYATIISMMLRDQYGCNLLAPYECQPLFTSDPMQVALVNGEESYEQRWMITAVLQFNPIVTVSQQFADQAEVVLVSVDANFPPS